MEKLICMEVGMSDGFDTKRIWDKYHLPIYGFEPVPALFTQTTERFGDNPKINVFPYAVDIEDGESDFHLSNPHGKFTDGSNRTIHPYGCSSLHEFSDDIHKKWVGRPDFNVVETIQVKTTRIDTFLSDNKFDGEIEFLHCDAQGNDVNVLESFGDYIKCLKSGVIEVAGGVELYKNTNNTINQAKKFLLSQGFVITNGINPKARECDIRFRRI